MHQHLKQLHLFVLLSCLAVCLSVTPISARAADELAYKLDYTLQFLPASKQARVTIEIDKGKLFRTIKFSNEKGRYTNIQANGKLTEADGQVTWEPPQQQARLTLTTAINHERDPGFYDAMMTDDWTIFRGDDVFPAVKADFEDGAYAVATLKVKLPKGWTSVETGWPRGKNNLFRINNRDRKFDRPTGWMIAGKLGTRRDKISKTNIAVSAPKGQQVHRMDVLTYFNFVWPELKKAFGKAPRKLLVVQMGNPMWRGGLSASNSLFLHSDRPLVSENGTSPLLHELTHMVTRIRGQKIDGQNDDWIAEGLAEFYSFELLYRAGGISEHRRSQIIARLDKWGSSVKHLRLKDSSGANTARAVVLFDQLDQEIRQSSQGYYSIDNVTRDLMARRKVTLADLEQSVQVLLAAKSRTLQSPLLK